MRPAFVDSGMSFEGCWAHLGHFPMLEECLFCVLFLIIADYVKLALTQKRGCLYQSPKSGLKGVIPINNQ